MAAAKYMVAVGAIIKSLYSNLFHVTCVAHLLHNYVTKVKSYFEDVEHLIAKANQQQLKTQPNKPNALLLVARLSLLL